ncbi:MAG: MBOAT family O-acyltransferase [Anaerolineae bacterium]|nr:MBOAT family O-acyltransferase [Anaerolineae bacterium]MDQ7036491.1 MBOAT family O-acyltransferase [Anaerolineae bacterium]
MSFISPQYIVFFAVVVPLYFALPLSKRWILLLIASYIFYAFSRVEYVLLIAFSTLVDYFAARQLDSTPATQIGKRRLLLSLSIIVNLTVLFTFKYFNFFNESLSTVFAQVGFDYQPITHSLILPVGISFYTFQSMAYTIDVYRGRIPVETNLGIFATYVAFFPQLVAGPIERAQNLLPQFRQKYKFDYDRVVSGLRLILWGAFKKVVIADSAAVYVNKIYNGLPEFTGLPLLLATIFFTFQIYCDFSGYSDIAIGSARVMGFDLMENFRQPYLSRSIREFWQRWHISLSTWFRDYVYIPLGGNRSSLARYLFNLMFVFVVSGLWHGSNWTFVIWGTLHGLYIIAEVLYTHRNKQSMMRDGLLLRWFQQGLTFTLVVFAWIFFRANTLSDAQYVITNMFNFSRGYAQILHPFLNNPAPKGEFLMLVAVIGFLMLVEIDSVRWNFQKQILKNPVFRWLIYYLAALIILFNYFRLLDVRPPFIYFQF